MAVAVVSLVGGAAVAVDVKTDYDKEADFTPIKTFAVKLGTGWGNEISEKRVVDAVTKAIAAKGWTPVAEDQADALVVVHGASSEKQTLHTFYDGWGGYGWYGWGGMSMGSSTTTTYTYTVGTIVVDVFDAKSKALLWRGHAEDEIKNSVEKREKQLNKALTKLFQAFPPKPAKQKA
jgi:hypothetical protein